MALFRNCLCTRVVAVCSPALCRFGTCVVTVSFPFRDRFVSVLFPLAFVCYLFPIGSKRGDEPAERPPPPRRRLPTMQLQPAVPHGPAHLLRVSRLQDHHRNVQGGKVSQHDRHRSIPGLMSKCARHLVACGGFLPCC